MFKNSPAFSSFSTDDIDKAKQFYGSLLGLDFTEEEMGVLRVKLGTGGTVIIYPKDTHTPATFTVLSFVVTDIVAAVEELTQKGITFEHYPDMNIDEKGIAHGPGPLIAWFKDPAGNILAVIEDKMAK